MRTLILVIDSFGIGALPDADHYGDVGSNTALHICQAVPGQKWSNMKEMGLGNASEILGNVLPGCESVENPSASFGVMAEASPGKDTTTGHWEMAGIILNKAFSVFPQDYPSFPKELLDDFTRETGYQVIGNKAASGTEIIKELGEEHIRTGKLIAYTSADSVFQIAAHDSVIGKEELYRVCEITRNLCDKYMTGRVIARPFTGEPGHFERTKDRHDFSIALPGKTFLDLLSEYGVETIAVGKIGSIFNEQGITTSFHDAGNPDCLSRTLTILKNPAKKDQSIFVNLVDTDMVYGHRRDPEGYCRSVEETDKILPEIIDALKDGDVLFITGDHGCDPSFRGTDHTREYVPILMLQKGRPQKRVAMNLGKRKSFSDLAATILKLHGVEGELPGFSFN